MADDEVLATDAEQFNCETCLVADALDTLDADNAAAWALFQRVCSRFVVDLKCAGAVVMRLTAHLEPDDFLETLERLAVVYDVLYPPKVDRPHGA